MVNQRRGNSKKRFWRLATIGLVATAAIIITIVIVVHSVDWQAYLDEHLAKAMKLDTGPPTKSPKDVGLAFKNVVITTKDGVHLAGWFVPNEGSRVTIIFCRGAMGNIGVWLDMIKRLHDQGHNVLAFDYRGTGLSGGEASFLTTEKDIEAAVNYAKRHFGRAASRIGILGVSIGAAVGIDVAANLDMVDAVVADSPFSSFGEMLPRIIKKYSPQLAGKVPEDAEVTAEFDPIRSVAEVAPKPLFIIANENDTLCPAGMARKLYKRARPPKYLWVAPGTEHIGAKDVFAMEYWAKIGKFFDRWLVGARSAEFEVVKKVKQLPDGQFGVKLRLSNIGDVLSEPVPVAVIIETEAGEVTKNVYFPDRRLLSFTLDSRPLSFRAMRFFHVKRSGDTWELLPG